MGSEIGNKGLLRNLGRILGITNPRQAPTHLNTDEIIPTADLMAGGFANYSLLYTTGNQSLNGLQTSSIVVAGPSNSAGPFFGNHLTNDNLEARILAAQIELTISAADITAMVAADAYLAAQFFYRDIASAITPRLWMHQRHALRDELRDTTFVFSLFGGMHGANSKALISTGNSTPGDVNSPALGFCPWLPAGQELVVNGGAVFPPAFLFGVNSLMAVKCLFATVPRGTQPPI